MERQVRFRTRRITEIEYPWSMKMTREDDQVLPMCQHCGKYKGVGPCKDPSCQGFQEQSEDGQITKTGSATPCCMCYEDLVVSCTQCGRGYCESHGKGAELSRLSDFHQHVGTCIECKRVVCENCWILNPNGDIVCLAHLEKQRKTQRNH